MERHDDMRRAILERDDYQCTVCGDDYTDNPHHLRVTFKNPPSEVDEPTMDNRGTVCEYCQRRPSHPSEIELAEVDPLYISQAKAYEYSSTLTQFGNDALEIAKIALTVLTVGVTILSLGSISDFDPFPIPVVFGILFWVLSIGLAALAYYHSRTTESAESAVDALFDEWADSNGQDDRNGDSFAEETQKSYRINALLIGGSIGSLALAVGLLAFSLFFQPGILVSLDGVHGIVP